VSMVSKSPNWIYSFANGLFMAINAGDLSNLLTGMILQVYLLISKAIYTALISPFRTVRAHHVRTTDGCHKCGTGGAIDIPNKIYGT